MGWDFKDFSEPYKLMSCLTQTRTNARSGEDGVFMAVAMGRRPYLILHLLKGPKNLLGLQIMLGQLCKISRRRAASMDRVRLGKSNNTLWLVRWTLD